MTLNEKIKYMDKKNRFELWKSQIDTKNTNELISYYKELINQMNDYDSLKRDDYDLLLNKVQYIENRLGIQGKIGRELN